MTSKKATRRCAIYVRISVAQEASVSIDRQIEAARQYAAARGWTVAAVFRDEGISATHNKPEDRVGWRALLDSPETFDAVLVWKIDRLARKVLDFLHADEALQARGAGIVAVEDPVDMTTAQGRAFATLLAVFGEMEAEAIRARVKAARDYLIRNGRVVGGTIPYGWRSVPNPDGKGFVLAHDADTIDYVRGMADRALAGRTVYSICQWLDEVGAPLPKASQSTRKRTGWNYTTVERLLRNPVLAGMTPYNPGNGDKRRGADVLRGEDGLPFVDEAVAIMPVGEWRAMVAKLDDKADPRSKPRALRAKTSGVLSGLVFCAEHADEPARMWRGTTQGRHGYYCRECGQVATNFEHVVVNEFLRVMGDHFRLSRVDEVLEGDAALLREINVRLAELGVELVAAQGERATELLAELARLKDMQADAENVPTVVRTVEHESTVTYAEAWAAAETDEDRRDVLGDALDKIWVIRGGAGKKSDAAKLARLVFEWRPAGQVEAPSDEELAAWAS
ncbi:recombinase family protein [Pimelobacter simplex]|uniref:recombinase family protein n=1 Tax=Nocardioides simplex TaxID=2045 RepID=UPI003AABB614